MGLMVELTPPDKDVRIGILKKLSADNGLEYTDEALNYIAEHYYNNVRELEGAFNRVSAFSDMTGSPLTIELARKILKCDETKKEIDLSKIANVVADYYNVSVDDLKGSARSQKISAARHMAVYLSRELCGNSFVSIAEFFNKKHTTIMFAHDKIQKEISCNSNLASD
jgi:chromosomal replication initiator protein